MKTPGLTAIAALVFAVSPILWTCSSNPVDSSVQTEAPFIGPAFKQAAIEPGHAPDPHPDTWSAPAQDEPKPAPPVPSPPTVSSNAEQRRIAWLTQRFRCRAISTVKMRGCRFEEHEGGYRLAFQVSDVVCNDVEFDEDGDPSKLVGCRSSWLRIPKNNKLKRGKRQDVWSGSHSGWRWKDGEKYCCPGLWIEAPESLKEF